MALTPPKRLVWAILLTAFGMAFPYGYHLGVVNLTQHLFEDFVNETYAEHHNHEYLHGTSLDALWAFIVASFTLGGTVGGLLCAFLAEKLGRKKSLLLAAIITLFGSILSAFSQKTRSYELLTTGRAVSGLSVGLGSTLLCIFLSEISPVELRGFSGGFLEIFLVFGKLTSQILSLNFILGSETAWPYLIAFPIIPATLLILIIPFFPETPKFLRSKQKGANFNDAQVRSSVKFYHGNEANVEKVINEIDNELELMTNELSVVEICRHWLFRKCLFMALVIRLGQELTGITAIFNFSTGILQALDFSQTFSQYNSIGIAAMSAVVTSVAVFAVEHTGRRFLLVYGLLGTLISDVLLMVFALINDYYGTLWSGYACMAVLYVHVFLFSCGPGPVGWLIVPELVPQVARSGVTSAGVFINWTSNLLVTAAFLPLKSVVGHYSFLMFIVPLAFCTLYLYLRLPETQNKPVDEIVKLLERGRRQDDEVPLAAVLKMSSVEPKL